MAKVTEVRITQAPEPERGKLMYEAKLTIAANGDTWDVPFIVEKLSDGSPNVKINGQDAASVVPTFAAGSPPGSTRIALATPGANKVVRATAYAASGY